MTRDQRRSRRKHAVRARTIRNQGGSGRNIRVRTLQLYPDTGERRPMTRAGCIFVERPCPFVSCAHNLYLDVTRRGGLKLNFPDLEPDEMAESCALDCADRGGMTLEAIGDAMNLTRERVRQMVNTAARQVREQAPAKEQAA